MEQTITEKPKSELSQQTYNASELFSRLPASMQDEIISLLRTLLSGEE